MTNDPAFYISLTVLVAVVLSFVVILTRNKINPFSLVSVLIFICAMVSMALSEESLVGIALITIAIVLSFWEIIRKLRGI